ncbi:hypothetical protein XENOCAPTIV_001167, partial [Xenoophorus captivus]
LVLLYIEVTLLTCDFTVLHQAGTFSIASEDVLKNRAIKKAKRRNTGGEAEHRLFVAPPGLVLQCNGAESVLAALFFHAAVTAGQEGEGPLHPSFCCLAHSSFSILSGVMFNGPSSTQPTADITTQQTNGSAPSPTQSSCSSIKEYSRQLTALNYSVRDWITKHVNDNPLCDLNPIFRDYERHLASIERKYGAASADGGLEEKKQGATSTPLPLSSSSSAAPSAALFSFTKTTTEDATQKSSSSAPLPAGVTFNFGGKVDGSVLGSIASKSSIPSFSFSSSSSQPSLFGAPGPAAPLSFGGTKTESAPAAGQQDVS